MSTEWLMDVSWGLAALEGLWRASWQGALWAAGAWAVTRAVPRMPAALRAGLWWLVSLKFVLSLGWLGPVQLPLLPAPAPAPAPVVEDSTVEPAGVAPLTVVTVAPTHAPAREKAGVPWRQVVVAVLLAAWGLGVAWQLRGHLRAWRAVRRLRHRAMPLRHPIIEEAIRELASEAGLRRVPRLLCSGEVKSPLATGLLSPVVVLPARALERLDEDALRMALAHELAHFQRRDLWLGWVPALAETVFFFHPLVRKAAREYALAREEACDAEALRLTGAEPGDYGQLLLTFGVTRSHGTAAALGASAHLHALHRRLTMLEHVDVSSPRGRAPLRAALLVLGLTVLVPFQVVARAPPVPLQQALGQTPPAPAPAASSQEVKAPAIAQPPTAPPAAKTPAAPPTAKAPAAPAAPATPKVASVPPVSRVAAVPPVPPTPPTPARPAMAPLPPTPPRPPMLARAEDDEDDEGMDNFVLVTGNQVTMAGSMEDLRLAKALRSEGKDVLYVRKDDKAYVIRDAKTLEQVRAAFEPELKLGAQQAELGKKQAALGVKQAEFGQKQAALGVKQAELGMKQAELGLQSARASMQGNEAEQQRIERELEKLSETLDKEQEALGEQQEALGREQEKLGRQMEGLARESRKKADAIIEEALRKGLGEPVKP